MTVFVPGMAVHCIDTSSRPEWAEWYGDERYSEDMLNLHTRYIVRAVAEKDGQVGLDIGVPTPWGDAFWNADRFRPALLREPALAMLSAGKKGADDAPPDFGDHADCPGCRICDKGYYE